MSLLFPRSEVSVKFRMAHPSKFCRCFQLEKMSQINGCLSGVERRRIYDIVNVLESVQIMSRLAKNKYNWHGKTNLLTTLSRLKVLLFLF